MRDVIPIVSDVDLMVKRLTAFKDRWYEEVFVNEPKELKERREYIRSLIRQGPVYQWLFNRTTTPSGNSVNVHGMHDNFIEIS